MEPMKILTGFIMDGKAGGLDKYLLTFLEQVQSDSVKVDFLTNKINKELQKQLDKYGSQLYQVANLKKSDVQYQQICDIIRKNQYDMTYFNISTAISRVGPKAAMDCNVPIRAIHSHSTGIDCNNPLKRKMLNYFHKKYKKELYKTANRFYACSRTAGLWLFPEEIVESEQFHIIHNSIDARKFSYDIAARNQLRNELHLENKFVIGHVGNFCYPKNYPFILEIFQALLKKNNNAVLLLVGTGPDFAQVKRAVDQMGLQENVIFLGHRADIHRIMQAMDVFILPSRFEGLALVAVEAQAAGLPCVFSTGMSDEAKITDAVIYLSINDPVESWVDAICSFKNFERYNTEAEIIAAGYDVSSEKEAFYSIICKK